MRIPRTNFSQAALHDANQADYYDDPQDGALSDMPTHDVEPVDPYQLYEAPAAPRRPANLQSDATAHVGRAARLYGQGTAYAPAQVTTSTDEPLPTLSEIAGHYGDSTWESHFFLAPNVRFTRTPEREFTKRRAPSDSESEAIAEENCAPVETVVAEIAAVEVAPMANEVAPVTVEVAVPAEAPVIFAAPVPAPEPALPSYSPSELLRVLTSQLPHWSSASKAEAANAVAIADVATQPAPTVDEAPVAITLPSITVEPLAIAEPADPTTERPTDTRMSFLSDFAFFEFGPSTGDDEPADAATAQPKPFVETAAPVSFAPAPFVSVPASNAAPIKAVEIRRMPPTAITSLFRVVECRPAAVTPSMPAAVEMAPVEPVSVEPVRDAPAPVIVPSEIASVPPVVIEPAEITTLMPEEEPVRTVTTVSKAAITMPAQVSRAPSMLPPIGVTERFSQADGYEFPSQDLLQEPPEGRGFFMSQEQLEQNAGLLESVLEDFGVRGEIIHVRPGPVVTLYEFEPAPGVKSSRVINLADDIARSMSALSARVAVVPGRNVIGIELPNATRETVYFRELIESVDFRKTNCKLALCLGKTIGGEPVIAELAKMPHLLVAGTTGSGKSVAINTMILSLLYRLKPEECRLIMVDPKMLELSVYDGIPHLLTPVVTDPKKAVMALKWAVREMEDRYRKMSRLGVRNIDGYNQRAAAAREKGEPVMCTVPAGFEKGTGEALFEQQEMDLAPMPYIVVIVDEMADLMMVAGKEIEGAIQRLAQMARAAGIHLIMATQRPSVDVITGTIKANFPTRISFQVTSKIDSRTILGEQGAEQLLGQGDMLHMQGGGRIARVHGPFVSDQEVEHVVAHLKTQGRPEYLETVTADEEEEEPAEEQGAVFDKTAIASEDGNELYDQAVKVVLRDKKCSTSYIQRRLGIGYNRAASLVERMEKEGLVGAANHVGKREIIHGNRDHAVTPDSDDMD
ncbi:DNA translocase FtsK [Ensifer adhaerens]|uniref:DNA translocase FtsK n=1 Tax=Ensifer adhaerens TaxID=106592 RepID=UPI001AEA52E2|nr:DNA translocase FtsK [Ensifer adhaerens]